MTDYSKITALYSRLSVGDEDRDGGESNSIQNQKIFLENYARGQHLTNIRHYIDDDESGRFFDRSAYSRMMDDVENGKIGVCIMKDLTRWGRDYLQVGNAMEIFRRNNVRFIAVNNGIDSEKPDTLEFAPFINIMSEWYAKDISKKVKTGIKTKGMSGKPIVTEAPYGYIKAPDNKDFWIIDEEAAEVVRLIFRLFIGGKNRNQIAVYLTQEQIPTPTFYMKDRGRGTCKNKTLNEDNRCKWNKATLTNILTRQEYCGDVVNFKTTKHFRDKHNHYVDRSQWHITENVHEPIISRSDFETVQRILENAPVRRPNGDGEIHPLSGLLFCKDCGAKMHIRIDYLKEHQRDFMPEDTKAGMIQAYLDKYTGETVCSKQLYKEALNHTFDEPKQWEIREINEIMNQCITGWNYFSNPRMFAEYGRQKGWEREIPATDTDNPPEKSMDGFVEVTEQMELPF